ncbi:MAG: 1-deoxy-D-xylulose-5-phosphate synthase [Clostridia bacterium]|nr:1-deoxy-D-xylulose-5-phosphate synthase [Clostridia bacterium]
MEDKILDKINSPDDLRAIPESDIPKLCSEMRDFLVENVERSGGHLASNLGVTELTVAIHRVFDSPRDHIIFDVGHQAYIHKIITGRKAFFSSLREPGGLSGFTNMSESKHDAFGAGHSSTSISAALGFAEADALAGSDAYTIAVIGDGAYTGGMVHEALNNCRSDLKLIIIINENRMSISKNKGAFASYLAKVRISKGYRKWKSGASSFLNHVPLIGKPLYKALSYTKNKIKKLVYPSNYFEDLGLYYIGPVNGNSYTTMEKALAEAKRLGKCTVIHAFTKKGKGYEPAEKSPDGFHSVASKEMDQKTLHGVFADELINLAEADKNIVAVTAAMGMGTGLNAFGEKYPHRYFDVGIAEEHALTFSAGLAAAGLKPFVAIYSTFLQRGYDNIVHDIALQKLPVRIMIDRAGIAVADGATHHGIFDVAFLSHIPNLELFAPVTYGSLCEAIRYAKKSEAPVAIRYANSAQKIDIRDKFYKDGNYSRFGVIADYEINNAPDCVFVSYGNITSNVIKAQKILESEGIRTGIILVEKIKPYRDSVSHVAEYLLGVKKVLFVEEGIKNGGYSMITESKLKENGLIAKEVITKIVAIDDNFVIPTEKCDIYDYIGLSAEKIADAMKHLI